ncbi:MAG: hypothetical protein ACYCQI_08520 [Gammaproteobacteria bacterium]
MASSQKKFELELKEAEKITAPLGVVNSMLGYEGSNTVSGAAGTAVSLVSTLFNSIKPRRLVRVRELLTAIVSGDPDKARAILETDPTVLLDKLEEKEFVLAPTGHKFNLKPYQAALAVDDIQMAAMIKPYFAKLDDEKEADRQYDEQCSKSKDEEKKWIPIFEQFNKLTFAIQNIKKGDITSFGNPSYIVTIKKGSAVEKELYRFWELLDASLENVITAGMKPFNPDLLLEAFKTYAKHFKKDFGDWDDPRALLFWQKVIGYDGIERLMPVNYVQAFKDWIDLTVERMRINAMQRRNTCFYLNDFNFYPLRPRGFIGFNFAIYGCRAAATPGLSCAGDARDATAAASAIEVFLCQKITEQQNLRQKNEIIRWIPHI